MLPRCLTAVPDGEELRELPKGDAVVFEPKRPNALRSSS